MIAFWSISALLVAGALLFLLPPLLRRQDMAPVDPRAAVNVSLYRDQFAELEIDLRNGTLTAEQGERSRRELQLRLLQDVPAAAALQAPARRARGSRARRRDSHRQPAAAQEAAGHARSRHSAAAIVGLGLPVAAFTLYLQLGNPDGLSAGKAAPTPVASPAADPAVADVARLAAYLEMNPQDITAWTMLARTYTESGRYAEAVAAYGKLAALAPDSAQVWAEHAVALAMASGRRLQGKPLELVKRALQLDPDNPQALALAGRAELEAGNREGAIALWTHLLGLLPVDSEGARKVAANIDRARRLAATDTRVASARTSSAAAGKSISGVVSLEKNLASAVSPNDTVFLYAHAPGARGMPLAAMRVQVKDLPATFSLDDSMAMTATRKLSDFPEVSVVARISKTGDALARSGDLQGVTPPVVPGSAGVRLVIDTTLP